MNKIKTIVAKEWAEVFRNRLVLFTVAFLPLIFIAIPIGVLIGTAGAGELAESEMEELTQFGVDCTGMTGLECGQGYFLELFTLLFMILPVAIPVTIASYSIVGEKTMRTLEPLLATPITTLELLAGKAIAAVVPAVVATWLSFGIYLLVARLLVSDVVFAGLLDPLWLIAVFVVAPLLSLLAVGIAILISSRVSDPRTAEQLSMLVILPIILFLVGQTTGLILLNRQIILIAGVVVALCDIVIGYLALRLFERETILTRWQ